ncbi:circularly permuted type 2 ATP-grasp protein [Nocardioides sp. REDSEA-S30_B4]|uniref:circularly permuted type 2 ATP-grasp protein n=1 Tax=Nocardioides sp. REDSEA-S30_B4 TaxID=1811552 RepID=UPI000AC3C6F4|nr:circularly permuted type 2 ATP-grasp protein [Nocardioides sp. REDSEA-S30_B4]
MTVLRDYAAATSQPTLGDPDGPGRFDEVVGPDGSLRPAWKGLAELAVSLTPGDMYRADSDIARFLADDGVTYARPGDRQGPWRLDPVPLVIDARTWAPLEKGLAQRAELFNALLVDLYGDQRLLAEGVVPPAVVLGHGGFTRAVARRSLGEQPIDPRPLVFSATDLARDAAGEWRVIGDRAQAPSGLGYAMENRRVISRVVPELYRQAGLHRMEPYFWALRSALIQSANGDLADPRVVVLSPGTHSETAYDQAFVASTLGFPLVQGSDLLIRDGWVYLRQGRGRMERVDVILRRVDAAWSDPLELRGESQLGVAGLVEAVRRGRVRVVNGLGSGVLENPGLAPYLPLHVRPIDGPSAELERLPTAKVIERILDEPHRYVGQERLPFSQVPTWRSGAARPRPVTLRTFALRYGGSYRPLVGGLANVYDDGGFRSSASKDVWVLKADPADADQGLAEVMSMTAARAVAVTVPRVLEDLFWVGRYAERAEDMLRLLIVTHTISEDFRTSPGSVGGASLAVLLGTIGRLAGRQFDDLDAEFRSLLTDADRVGSVAHSIENLRTALTDVRDQLSADTWRAFGVVERAHEALAANPHSHQVADTAGRILTGVLSLQGVFASMMRDDGWHMIGAGRSLERSLQLVHLLRSSTTVRRGIDVDRTVLNAVLESAESSVTHRRRYRGYVRPAGVLELLVVDPDNPRSLAFSLAEVRDHVAALPASTGSTRPERLVENLLAEVEDQSVAELVAIGGVNRPNLESFLDDTLDRLARLGESVEDLHLRSGPPPRSFGALAIVDSLPAEPATGTIPAITEPLADDAPGTREGA